MSDCNEDSTGNLMFIIHVRRGVTRRYKAMLWCLKGCWDKLVHCTVGDEIVCALVPVMVS